MKYFDRKVQGTWWAHIENYLLGLENYLTPRYGVILVQKIFPEEVMFWFNSYASCSLSREKKFAQIVWR